MPFFRDIGISQLHPPHIISNSLNRLVRKPECPPLWPSPPMCTLKCFEMVLLIFELRISCLLDRHFNQLSHSRHKCHICCRCEHPHLFESNQSHSFNPHLCLAKSHHEEMYFTNIGSDTDTFNSLATGFLNLRFETQSGPEQVRGSVAKSSGRKVAFGGPKSS